MLHWVRPDYLRFEIDESIITESFTEHGDPAWVCPVSQPESLTIQTGSFRWEAIPASVTRWRKTDA